MPDLFGQDFDILNEPLVAGSTFDIDYEIGNVGTAVNGPFQVSFYLSKNSTIAPNAGLDILLSSSTITGLGSSPSTGTFTRSLTLPGINDPFWQTNSGDGTYHIGMVIDSLNQVAESNEANNRNRGFLLDWDDVVINNTLSADLVATSANVVLEPQTAGNTFDFDYNISNIGGAATGNYTVSFYLSSNDFISTADQSLGSV
ncbi:CARDB domain-containing protein, partial [Leptothoe sp. PORK10 BA2]|uniref:CARDB domain-containing protein n=1 Tax=Leptothoe sp. PORK10 BA2 TaxID=3110254 RepID=UPI002B205544